LGALLSQLLKQNTKSNIPESETFDLFDRHDAKATYPTIGELETTLYKVVNNLSKVFIVIDALDELADREGIIDFLSSLTMLDGNFKVFVASRRDNDLEAAFGSFGNIAITSNNIEADIEQYVRYRIGSFGWADVPDLDGIVQELVRRADGMQVLSQQSPERRANRVF
jgi:hypothetical protein